MGKKKICLVIPSLQAGGMERVMSVLANYSSLKENLQVHLILYGISRSIFYHVSENIIVHKPMFTFNNSRRFFHTIRTLFFIRKTVNRLRPESILSFGEYWNNFVLLSLLATSYPVFVSDRSQPGMSLGWFQDSLRQWLYPNSDGLILQTEKAKQIYLAKNSHNNIAVIGNPISIPKIENLNEDRELNILMVGRLIRTKHQDELIKVFARINNPAWKLVLVGYDHLKQENMQNLKDLSIKLNVDKKVIFAGKQTKIEEIYARSSIFAFTSSSEGFPNAIGEAMAYGLPVIAYDCIAGPSEMIKDGFNGYLIPLFDNMEFEKKLNRLMSDKRLRKELGKNARESIQEFDSDKISEKFLNFITKSDMKENMPQTLLGNSKHNK